MKLDAILVRHLSSTDYRVLTAIEMGMKNHEWVPIPLIESIAKLRRTGLHHILQSLLQHKLIAHTAQQYDGYKLTYQGYDYLALRAFSKRGTIQSVGRRIGVGKEADVHLCQDSNDRLLCLKFHRLGRVSFRTIKNNRDYLQHRQHASWMYLSRLAALREYSCLKALWENNFRVPEPIDVNRHAVLMEFVDGTILSQVRQLRHPMIVFNQLMQMITDMASCGMIHGDFNEFNLLLDKKDKVTMIDFPQIVSMNHLNAQMYFERDVGCIRSFFHRRFSIDITDVPEFEEIQQQLQAAKMAAPCTSSASLNHASFKFFENAEHDVLVESLDALRNTEKFSFYSAQDSDEFLQTTSLGHDIKENRGEVKRETIKDHNEEDEVDEASNEEDEVDEESNEEDEVDEESNEEDEVDEEFDKENEMVEISKDTAAIDRGEKNKQEVQSINQQCSEDELDIKGSTIDSGETESHSDSSLEASSGVPFKSDKEEDQGLSSTLREPINVWKSTARRHRREAVRKHVKSQQKSQKRGNAGKKKDKRHRKANAMAKLDFV